MGSPVLKQIQAFKDKAKQFAQAMTAESNPNPATATTTAAEVTQPITGGKVLLEISEANRQAAQQAAQQAATLPPIQDTKPAKTWRDYLLWIALGGVVAFGAYKMLSGGKKKRR